MWNQYGEKQHNHIQPNGCEFLEQPLFHPIAIPKSLYERQFTKV